MKTKSLFLRSLFLVTVLLLVSSMVVSASPLAAATTKLLSTNYALVNLGSADAVVTATYYKPDGSIWDADDANESFNIPKDYGQIGIAQYFDQTLTSGMGSVVLSSSEPLGGVVQILARAPQVATSGAYSAITTPETKYLVPQIFKNLSTGNGLGNSVIVIQNASDADITVDVDFIPFPGIAGLSSYSKLDIPVPSGASYSYDLTGESNLSDGWTGSAVVTADSDMKIAVVVNTFLGANSLQTFNAFPASSASTDWAIPMFTSRLANKLSTSVTIQNVSGADIPAGAITMDCTPLSSDFGTAFSKATTAITPNNGASGFNPVTDTSIPEGWSGSCLIHSTANVVVMIQMRRPGSSEELAAYEAFPVSAAGTRVVVPAMSKHQPNGFATTCTIKNLDSVNSALVKLTYTPSPAYVLAGGSATPIVLNKEIPAGGSIGQNLRYDEVPEIPNQWYGTLLIEPQDPLQARPIVGIVQLSNWLGVAGDSMMAHDAIELQ